MFEIRKVQYYDGGKYGSVYLAKVRRTGVDGKRQTFDIAYDCSKHISMVAKYYKLPVSELLQMRTYIDEYFEKLINSEI